MKNGILILLVLVISGIFLNRAYSHIFKFLNAHNPGTPPTSMSIIIPAPNTNSAKKITFVSLGDSLTAGAGAATEAESYPYRLAELIAKKQNATVTLYNLAVSGSTSNDVLQGQVPKVAALKPDLVTLAIGTNDMHNYMDHEVFRQNMISILEQLTTTTKKLFVLNIPFLAGKNAFWPPYRVFFDHKTKQYNELIYNSFGNDNIYQIDLYTITHEKALNEPGYYSPDDFHPSAATYDYWSKLIYDHLNF